MTRTSLNLFANTDLHCSRDRRPEIFSLDDDMPQVERSFLADLLIADLHETDYWLPNFSKKVERVERFRHCGQEGQVHNCPACGLSFFSRFFCKHRLCDVCARIYGRQVYRRVMELIAPCLAHRRKGWTVFMLTLSESSGKYRGHYPSLDDYKRFNRHVGDFCRLFYGKFAGCFTRTGKVREDRKRYRGAGTIAVNEFGADNNNLHAHVLGYGPWIPWERLQRAWVRITGGDTGCYIEPIRRPDKAAHYVAKYITKPPRFMESARAIAFVKASKGYRRIRTGGIFYNQVRVEKPERSADLCPFCDVLLLYGGVHDLTSWSCGFDLRDVKRHPEKYPPEAMAEIVRFRHGGVTPIDLAKKERAWWVN